jgi:hypothetical protein
MQASTTNQPKCFFLFGCGFGAGALGDASPTGSCGRFSGLLWVVISAVDIDIFSGD